MYQTLGRGPPLRGASFHSLLCFLSLPVHHPDFCVAVWSRAGIHGYLFPVTNGFFFFFSTSFNFLT